jgi:hypothetical protein
VSSSGPDDDGAWLQVGAGALKHCVASGCVPEATLLLEAIRGPGNLHAGAFRLQRLLGRQLVDALKGESEHRADVAEGHVVSDQFFNECLGLCCSVLLEARRFFLLLADRFDA